MNALQRSSTIPSVHSWWSDSNWPGATMNLQAATKPLMRYLYFRQAKSIIRGCSGIPLAASSDVMPAFKGYLGSKYVSEATKLEVLRELARRGEDANDAHTIIKALAADEGMLVASMLLLTTPNMLRTWTCEVIARVAAHESPSARSLWAEIQPCGLLVELLREPNLDSGLKQAALSALAALTSSVDDDELQICYDAAEDLIDLVQLLTPEAQGSVCAILANLVVKDEFSAGLEKMEKNGGFTKVGCHCFIRRIPGMEQDELKIGWSRC
ncbi:hypothetical protein MKEN_01486500 [Mycena kentingensis (nom. inval.)]|nr:hypothetical protein MKEN_01486500 [Mycena kentingensis (nom. inval.)]